MKKIILTIISILWLQTVRYSEKADSFDLAGIIEGFINSQAKADLSENGKNAKTYFENAKENLENGNVVVSYSEYQKTIDAIDNDGALIMLAKCFGIFKRLDKLNFYSSFGIVALITLILRLLYEIDTKFYMIFFGFIVFYFGIRILYLVARRKKMHKFDFYVSITAISLLLFIFISIFFTFSFLFFIDRVKWL